MIGAAESGCYRDENRWRNAERHALKSMAQTRATSKALGQVLRWIPELAGYSGTPAEEMPPDDSSPAPSRTHPPVAEILGHQDVETKGQAFGEEDFADPVISIGQARNLIKLAIKVGEGRGFPVLNGTLEQADLPPCPDGSTRQQVESYLVNKIHPRAYDAFAKSLEKFEPMSDQEERI